MSYSYDASGEYLHWDNPEAVTVSLRRSGGSLSRSVAVAVRDDLSKSRSGYGGIELSGNETGWSIPVALLSAGDEIETNDRIIDAAGVDWIVRSARKIAVGSSASHWECVTVRER